MNIDIEWLAYVSENQRSDVFYCDGYNHSPVCIVKGKYKKVLISCDGEMRAKFIDSDGEEHTITDFWELEEAGIKTDSDLSKYEDKLEWIENPWLDAYDITDGYHPENGSESMDHLDMVSGDLDEILNKVKNYIESNEK
jgi:hypothetical protein